MTRVAFAGPGTIVQRLTLPPLSTRNRLRAVETHLRNYADGHELSFDMQAERASEEATEANQAIMGDIVTVYNINTVEIGSTDDGTGRD